MSTSRNFEIVVEQAYRVYSVSLEKNLKEKYLLTNILTELQFNHVKVNLTTIIKFHYEAVKDLKTLAYDYYTDDANNYTQLADHRKSDQKRFLETIPPNKFKNFMDKKIPSLEKMVCECLGITRLIHDIEKQIHSYSGKNKQFIVLTFISQLKAYQHTLEKNLTVPNDTSFLNSMSSKEMTLNLVERVEHDIRNRLDKLQKSETLYYQKSNYLFSSFFSRRNSSLQPLIHSAREALDKWKDRERNLMDSMINYSNKC